MRIDVKGRNVPVSAETRALVERRFRVIERQVSAAAELEVELREERNPAIPDREVAEATLHLKGVTLRACSSSPDLMHSVIRVSEELTVQVKRHRDKRRGRRVARVLSGPADLPPPMAA